MFWIMSRIFFLSPKDHFQLLMTTEDDRKRFQMKRLGVASRDDEPKTLVFYFILFFKFLIFYKCTEQQCIQRSRETLVTAEQQ